MPAIDAAEARAARERASAFLRDQLRAGNYGLAVTGSDGTPRVSDNQGHLFVASFLADALHGEMDEIERTIILMRVFSQEDDGLWGFNPPQSFHDDHYRVFAVDADDTAFVLRTLRRIGANRNPRGLAAFYREEQRLFATFNAPDATRLATQRSAEHNLAAHVDVNLNVFMALRGTHLEHLVNYELLLRTQTADGFWQSYFYPSVLYGTLLALDVMNRNPALAGISAFADAQVRARAAIAAAQAPDGSWGDRDVYETALAVAALTGSEDHTDSVERGVAFLLARQERDGSWRSPAVIWEFHFGPDDVWRAYDMHRSYVTARCVTALRRAADI